MGGGLRSGKLSGSNEGMPPSWTTYPGGGPDGLIPFIGGRPGGGPGGPLILLLVAEDEQCGQREDGCRVRVLCSTVVVLTFCFRGYMLTFALPTMYSYY